MLKRTLLLFVVFVCAVGLALGAKTRKRGNDEKPGTLTISVRDFCDPTTFDAAVGAGTCVRVDNVSVNGSQKFAGFVAEVGQEKSAGAWRFNPDRVHTEEGVNLTLVNRGGETHTFTRVAQFGGGFIDFLNAASGNPVPRPECAKVLAGGVLAPQPESANNIFLEHGESQPGPRIVEDEEAKFMCCIHPWMRITFNGKEGRKD